jgi:tetratricopeptide (TPR) repeat protein
VIELLLQAERALSVGLLDRAETLYRQVATADPRNSIAVVGLARVAIERGDELEALELGRRALEIDPENSAAQRLVQRLEEVRAYRGEATPAARPSAMSAEVPVREPEPPTETPPTDLPTPSGPPPQRRSFLDRLFGRR